MYIRPILLALASTAILLSCKKKNEVISCTEIVRKAPSALAFAGYRRYELDTVVVQEYVAGSNFTQLVNTIVSNDTNLMQLHDTLLKAWAPDGDYYTGVADLRGGYEYRIFVSSANRTYDITNIEYSQDSILTFQTTEDVCPPYEYAHPKYRTPIRLDVNGQTEQITFKYGNVSVLFIKK
jgi:hypothetical protein